MVDPIQSRGPQDNLSYRFVSPLLFSLPLKIPRLLSITCSICPFLFSSTLFSCCGDLQICKWNHSFWQTFSCQTWHYHSVCMTTSLLKAIIQQSYFSQFCPFSSPWSITCNRQHRNSGMVGFATDLQSHNFWNIIQKLFLKRWILLPSYNYRRLISIVIFSLLVRNLGIKVADVGREKYNFRCAWLLICWPLSFFCVYSKYP